MTRYSELATYNAEVDRGVSHTLEKVARMVSMQERFDLEQLVEMCRTWDHVVATRGGGWLCFNDRVMD